MSVFKNSKELPAIDIFEDLFHLVFNCKWEGENIIQRELSPIKQEDISLLLAWPGILMIHLAEITGDTTYQNSLKELRGILSGDTNAGQIRAFLDTIIVPQKIPNNLFKEAQEALKNENYEALNKLRKKIHRYLPRIIIKFLLLLHPKNLSFVLNLDLIVLYHSLSNYFVLCCMLIRCLDRNDGDRYITNREVDEGYFKCGLQNQFDVYWISRIWSAYLNYIIKLEVNRFSKFSQENKDPTVIVFSKICTPSLKISIHRILPENTFAYIKEFDCDPDELVLFGNLKGFGYNISRNLGYDSDLWKLFSFNYPKSNGYLYFNEKNDFQNNTGPLVGGLYKSARQSAIAIKSIITSWDTFLKDPYEIIEEKLEKFDEWIFSFIYDSFQTRDEFLKFKSFTRVIGDIDTELDYEIVNEVRDKYKEAKHYHIPNELRQKLLKAKEELDIFVKLVIKKLKLQEGRLGDEDNLLNYFDAHKEKFNYLKLLEHNDIKKLNFSTGANASRDNRRKILPIINKKLGGKNYKESALTKLLGLEPGGEKYLKYSK